MNEKIKICLIDRALLFRRDTRAWFKRLPRYQLIGEYVSAKQFFRSLKRNVPDAVCVLSKKDAEEIIASLQKKFPKIKILLPDCQDKRILRLLKMRLLLQSCVVKDKAYIDPYVSKTLLGVGHYMNEEILISALQKRSFAPIVPTKQTLSLREQQVVALITLGYASKEIASILDIKESSVKTIRKRLLKKIGGRSKSDIIAYGLKHKLDRKFGYNRKKILKKAA